MKTSIPVKVAYTFAFCLGLLLASCGSNNAENAENKDTVSTGMTPKPDNATVRPDTIQTQVPQDSGMGKEKMK